MNKTLNQIIIIAVLSVILGGARNILFSNDIDFVGKWRDLSSGEEPIIPPTAEEGDPVFIAIDVAEMEHSTGKTLFIDARDPEEFECGTIPGSINIPFDYLPEGDLAPYFDSAMGGIALDYTMVVFCSGEECDLSLHLARNMQDVGYTNLMIFFGGSREWENYELEIERVGNCEE